MRPTVAGRTIMDIQTLIPVAIAFSAVGFFAAAWLRFSKPVRLMNGKARVIPQV